MNSIFARILVFLAVFSVLQSAWTHAHGGQLERLWIDGLTVPATVAIVNLVTPAAQANGVGSHIVSPGGGLNVLSGCDGADVLFLLLAALCAAPASIRAKVAGMLLACVFVLSVNVLRVVSLFYAHFGNRQTFDLLHTTITPIVLVALAALFFAVWLDRAMKKSSGLAARLGRDRVSA